MVISNLNTKLIEDRLGFNKELFSILKNNLTDMEEFVKEIKNFLEKYRKHAGRKR